MNKNLKITIIISLIVIVFLALFFVFKKDDANNGAGGKWTSLDKNVSEEFIKNNFALDLAKEIDLESFVLYGDISKQYYNSDSHILYAKDARGVYMRLLCNDVAFFVEIEEADPDSFEILNHCYSKDENRVYFTNVVITDANSKTFKVLDRNYSKDSIDIYFQQYAIVGADMGSFKIVSNNEKEGYYSKDKEHLFQRHLIVSNLAPENFTIEKTDDIEKGLFDCLNNEIDKDTFEVINSNYAKDKNNVYIFVRGDRGTSYCYKIAEADPESFEVVFNFWAKDSDSTFHEFKEIIGDVDSETFEVIDDNYAKDETHVYYQGSEIPEADPETFEVIDDNYAVDDENVYLEDEIIPDADPETFEIEDEEEDDDVVVDDDIFDDIDIDEDDDEENYYVPSDDNTGIIVDYDIDIFSTSTLDEGENCYFKKADDGPYVERHCSDD